MHLEHLIAQKQTLPVSRAHSATTTGLLYSTLQASTAGYTTTVFIARRSKRGTCYGNVAGWVAGCLSHAGIVSKRLNLS